jgi:tetratricopeptide (TPR) repeat protein
VASATAALDAAPEQLEPRFRLVDALLEASCYDAAVHVLEEGERYHPRSTELQSRLRTTRSLQTEQTYFEGLEHAEIAARTQRNKLRCARLGDIAACDEALKLQPDDGQALIGKADALMRNDRPAEAVSIYRRVAELGFDSQATQSKLATATARRQVLSADCQSGSGAHALQACRAALLAGAEDEFLIRKRNGILLQAANQPADSLDEFIAASALRRDDKSVAQAIVALTTSTQRQDAAALTALGAAQLTLGRASAAVTSLRQAQALAPGIPEIRAQLAEAERLALAEAPKPGSAGSSVNESAPVKLVFKPVTPPQSAATSRVDSSPARVYSNLEPATRTH